MRRESTVIVALAACALATGVASAQTEIELRGATTDYRFIGLSHTFDAGLVLDAVRVDLGAADELYLGAGYAFETPRHTDVIPILYAVSGREEDERGLTLGALVAAGRTGWRLQAFFGHFFRSAGEVGDYSFVDTLDLTHPFGDWEIGVSSEAFRSHEDSSWLLGPVVKRNDRRGAWSAALRFGDDRELRVGRTLAF